MPLCNALMQHSFARLEVAFPRLEVANARLEVANARLEVANARMQHRFAGMEHSFAQMEVALARGHVANNRGFLPFRPRTARDDRRQRPDKPRILGRDNASGGGERVAFAACQGRAFNVTADPIAGPARSLRSPAAGRWRADRRLRWLRWPLDGRPGGE